MSEKMREILFRGKREDNGRWIQGDYQHFHIENDIYVYIGIWGEEMRSVKPETVGQFTGLTDNNGEKIFEGDIVDIIDGTEYGVIEWLDDEAMFACHERGYWSCLNSYSKHTISVVGNIHDNPELLKEAPNV